MITRWPVLPKGVSHAFSLSGHAVAFNPGLRSYHNLEIRFLDTRKPIELRLNNVAHILWISDTELIFVGRDISSNSIFYLLSIETEQVREICDGQKFGTLAWPRRIGHASFLGEYENRFGLYDIEAASNAMILLSNYDQQLDKFEVYYHLGHTFFPDGERLVIVGRLRDHTEERVEENSVNRQWHSANEKDWLAHARMVLSNSIELNDEKTRSLFIIGKSSEHHEIIGTKHASHPLLCADGTVIAFEVRRQTHSEQWFIVPDSGYKQMAGMKAASQTQVMHPDGVFYFPMITELSADYRVMMASRKWQIYFLQNRGITSRA